VTTRIEPPAIFIIRHGEKPAGPKSLPQGVTLEGVEHDNSLIPRGWQRAGALCTLFKPQDGGLRPDILTPDLLIAPWYKPDKTKEPKDERTHETIEPLSKLLGKEIVWTHPVTDGAKLGAKLAKQTSGVTLVCWEHGNIPSIGQAISPEAPGEWQDDRFDVIWRFTGGPGKWTYALLAQLLLPCDKDVPPGV
jgi:hypothetical protein